MLRRHQEFYTQILQMIDVVLLGIALYLAHALRVHVVPLQPWVELPVIQPFEDYLWIYLLLLTAGPILLEYQGIYRFTLPWRPWHYLWRVGSGILILMATLLFTLFLLKVSQDNISRGVLLLYVPVAASLICFREWAFRAGWLDRQGHPERCQHLMLVGTQEEREAWKQQMLSTYSRHFSIKAELDLSQDSIETFIRHLHQESIDTVIFSTQQAVFAQGRKALEICEIEGVESWISVHFFKAKLSSPMLDAFFGQPLVIYRSTEDSSWQLLAKHFMDRIVAALSLVAFFPLLVLVALAVFLTSGSPVLFRQKRSGLHGRPFVMYKFRTMVSNAEQLHSEILVHNQMQGPAFKMDNDPRVTPLGYFLRRYSLDELPQLWNILRGDMSLVGPRPLPVWETENFNDLAQRRRLSVPPGLTCLWQISGRNQIKDFEDWVRLDLEYIDRWSFWLDLQILVKTIPAVLLARGAK